MAMNIIKSTPSLQFAVGQGSVVPFLNRCTVGTKRLLLNAMSSGPQTNTETS